MSESLKIVKGGKLIETKWVYDKVKDEGSYVKKDVTDQAIRLLFDKCELDKGITLRDVLLLLNTELEIFNAVFGNWCKEFVTEGLNGAKSDDNHAKGIDYLELYWHFDVNQEWEPYPDGPRQPEPGSIKARLGHSDEGDFTGKKGLFGYLLPGFHGIHFITDKDRNNSDEPWNKELPEGSTLNYGISFCNVADLADLPLKLNQQLTIAENYVASKDYRNYRKEQFEECEYSLSHILYGIIWELSWNGDPTNRDEKRQELKAMTEEIKNENSTS